MPQGQSYWNPYRWVPMPDGPPHRQTPAYYHRLENLRGRLTCDVEALTPLLIGDGGPSDNIQFVKTPGGTAYVPGTSLKGMLRQVLEVVSGSAVPFGQRNNADTNHQADQASAGAGSNWQLDAAARLFGYMDNSRSYTGEVRMGDAPLKSSPTPASEWPAYTVETGTPKPTHTVFYKGHAHGLAKWKFYHHATGAEGLRENSTVPENSLRKVRPAPSDSLFGPFTLAFQNLTEAELNLLAYVLVLEENVTVTLGPEAMGTEEGCTLSGPLRHKLGACKPQGGGSIRIVPLQMQLEANPLARYQTGNRQVHSLEGEPLQQELRRRANQVAKQIPQATREAFHAMLVYDPNDPRAKHLQYPDWDFFQNEKQKSKLETPLTKLKPTL